MNKPDDHRHEHLPPELEAATKEYVEWSQAQLLIEQKESTPVEPLYHYTDVKALRGILAKQQVWCFRHLHQRDRTEFGYSLAIARRVIKEVGLTDDFFSHTFAAVWTTYLKLTRWWTHSSFTCSASAAIATTSGNGWNMATRGTASRSR